jgi:hypothetical protein
MALPTNTYTTYDTVGIKEDVANRIWNVDPDERPFASRIGKGKAIQTIHQWQTDVLDTPSDTNAHLEGDDFSGSEITPTVMLNNVCQILKKEFVISGTDEVVAKYGRGRETAYQKVLKKKALMNDAEMSMFANTAKNTGDENTARTLAGVPTWLTTNVSYNTSDGANPTGDGSDARTDGTQRAFTESELKDVLASIWDNSGMAPDCMFVGSFNKQAASAFTGSTTRFERSETKRLTTAIEIYEYDFGSISIIPARHIRSRDAFICSSSMWEIAQLRPLFEKPIAATGDSTKTSIIMEITMASRNEKASGLVTDLTSS